MVVNLGEKTPFSKLLTAAQKPTMSLRLRRRDRRYHVKPETTT